MKKTCNICNEEKTVELFYKNDLCKDGYQNRCIECTKQKSKEKLALINSDPVLKEKERARHRDKYYRLNYKEKHKPSPEKKKMSMLKYYEKFPERKFAKNATSKMKPLVEGNELHHWSYNTEHAKDVIEMSVKDHNTLHRYISYDKTHKMYRTKKGTLLDSKELHVKYFELVKELEEKLTNN